MTEIRKHTCILYLKKNVRGGQREEGEKEIEKDEKERVKNNTIEVHTTL